MRVNRGLRPAMNPIIVKELRTRMRGARPYLILTAFLVLLALTSYGIFQLMQQQNRLGGTLLSAQVGQALFQGLSLVELILVVFLAPSMTSGAISGEREHLTYDMLMATPLRPGQILWGKLIAALSYLFLLIFAAIPIFSIVLVFGGVDLKAVLRAVIILIASAIFFGALGIFFSALMRRTARATTLAYLFVLMLVGLSSVLFAIWGPLTGNQGSPVLVYLNPFSALLSVTTVVVGADPSLSSMSSFVSGDPFSGIPLVGVLGPGVVYYGPNGPLVLPLYRATLVGYSLLTTLLCWFSAHLVLLNRRWWPRWSDLGFALVLGALLVAAYLGRDWWYLLPPS